MKPAHVDPEHQNALIYCADDNALPSALFSASRAALLNPDRRFDILVCSLSPIGLPRYFLDLGIKPVHLDYTDHLKAAGVRERHLPITAFLRLWLPKAFADTYERILYVDTDTDIVDPSLSDFDLLDLGPHAIGGVRDKQQWTEIDRSIHEFKSRDLGRGAYMNGGVMLIDTEAFNRRGLLARLLRTNETMAPFIHHDQSLVNLTLRHEWAELHPHWNWQGALWYHRFTAEAAPRIIHYVGPYKPYNTNGNQLHYPSEIVKGYADFMAAHFPDRPQPEVPSHSRLGKARIALKMRYDDLRLTRQLRPLSGRFRDDFEVFT
ncbi:glycosyltransferase family 8 protein [Shimia aestuarii]|uniref:glycosyltransferase family 8 protein n=1 Tax=Shimia aestuarii TaxID=254406 RepID=UPI001FB443F9|nr:glycosyltransferase [Shimia aestuarii]